MERLVGFNIYLMEPSGLRGASISPLLCQETRPVVMSVLYGPTANENV